jgi:hypothetical protein
MPDSFFHIRSVPHSKLINPRIERRVVRLLPTSGSGTYTAYDGNIYEYPPYSLQYIPVQVTPFPVLLHLWPKKFLTLLVK